MRYFTDIDGEEHQVEVDDGPDGIRARIGDREVRVDLQSVHGQTWYSILLDGRSHDVHVSPNGEALRISVGPRDYLVSVVDERTRAAREATGAATSGGGPETVDAIMPGIVREILVAPGDRVAKGAALLILEAMKMQNEIRAPGDGVVESVRVAADTVVAKGDVLVTLAAAE